MRHTEYGKTGRADGGRDARYGALREPDFADKVGESGDKTMYQKEWFAMPGSGQKICLHRFMPDGAPRMVLQICHGMAEYLYRYRPFAEFLNAHGVLVCGIDHPGHGETEGQRGFFAERDGWQYLIEANVECSRRMHEDAAAQGVPYVILGHSMGSFVARTIAAFHGECADAYIFVGTAGRNPLLWLGRSVARVQKALCGPRHVSGLLQTLNFGPYNRGDWEHRTNVDWVCSDPDVVDDYVADEGCGFAFTASAFYDLYSGLRVLQSEAWVQGLDPQKPYLLLAGDADPVGNRGKGVTEVYERMKAAGIADVTLRLYPGMRHEILNETGKEEVYETVWAWLTEHVLQEKDHER